MIYKVLQEFLIQFEETSKEYYYFFWIYLLLFGLLKIRYQQRKWFPYFYRFTQILLVLLVAFSSLNYLFSKKYGYLIFYLVILFLIVLSDYGIMQKFDRWVDLLAQRNGNKKEN